MHRENLQTEQLDKGPKTVENETYDYAGVEGFLAQLEKSPFQQRIIAGGAEKRANHIWKSTELAGELKEGSNVLYIGAGLGYMPKNIERLSGTRLIKIDLSDIRTPDTKEKGDFITANARRLPFADRSMDTVFLSDILHHMTKQEEILSEIMRVLKPGGRAIVIEDTIPEVIEPNKRKFYDKITGLMDDAFNRQTRGVNPHNRHSVLEWEDIFKDAGFDPNIDSKTYYWGLNLFLGMKGSKHRHPLSFFESTCFKLTKPKENTPDLNP